jgi:hypothetical protein
VFFQGKQETHQQTHALDGAKQLRRKQYLSVDGLEVKQMGDDIENQVPTILDDLPEPEKWRIAQKGVSLSTQREYLDYHTIDLEQYAHANVSVIGERLLSLETPLDEKKKALAILAHTDSIEAYQVLKEYTARADEELEEWSVLALQECQAFIEASLSDRSVAMITGGLGGEGHGMRYFFAVAAKENRVFTDAEQVVVELAFQEASRQLGCEIEEMQFGQGYVAMEALISLEVAVAELIERGIRATNQVGDFLEEDYWVTNERVLTEREIKGWAQEARE